MMTRTGRAAAAGLAGAVAYLLAQEVDRRIVNPRSNDLILLGGFLTNRPVLRCLLGLTLHLFAGISMGLAFERFGAPRLCGPYWLRGIVMAQAENTSLFPLVYLLNRVHPAVKHGDLAPLWTRVYFWQEAWRHLALGLVMGAVLGPPPDDVAAGAAPGTLPHPTGA